MRRLFVILVLTFLLTGCFNYLPGDIGVDELPENQPDYPEVYKGEIEWDRSGGLEEFEKKKPEWIISQKI